MQRYFALDMPAVIDLIDGLVAAEDPDAAGVLRCLPLGVAAGGQTVSGSTVRHTAFVEISPRC